MLDGLWFKKAMVACSIHERNAHGIHGIDHWVRVFRNCLTIDPKPSFEHIDFYYRFAALHDCCRINDEQDGYHGYRAATFFGLRGKLEEAVSMHNSAQISLDPLIGTCWDADRLDLWRVGIIPEVQFLSTDGGRELLKRMRQQNENQLQR